MSNETIKTIYARRAVRMYKEKAVDKQLIEQLLDAGRMAPSAINKQPWKFYVLTNKEQILKFSKEISKNVALKIPSFGVVDIIKSAASLFNLAHGIDMMRTGDAIFHGAPVVIFITSPKDNEWAGLDVGMCAQNIMLAAKSLGLDTCPVGLAKFVEQTEIYSTLNTSGKEQVQLAIVVGYGNETPPVHERIKNNAVFI